MFNGLDIGALLIKAAHPDFEAEYCVKLAAEVLAASEAHRKAAFEQYEQQKQEAREAYIKAMHADRKVKALTAKQERIAQAIMEASKRFNAQMDACADHNISDNQRAQFDRLAVQGERLKHSGREVKARLDQAIDEFRERYYSKKG
jgi:hypothetical protein